MNAVYNPNIYPTIQRKSISPEKIKKKEEKFAAHSIAEASPVMTGKSSKNVLVKQFFSRLLSYSSFDEVTFAFSCHGE